MIRVADNMSFLPTTIEEMKALGWQQPDFVLITGDAYCDHPSFGHAVISRVLVSRGFRVVILSQPDWKSVEAFRQFGKPRLGFLINSGNVDSMVNHYSVFKRKRQKDVYAPGGVAGKRPDRAVIVYSGRAREAYSDVPVIIGGIEASLRRFGHYDYWEDKVRRSILLDAKADLLIYGMGEKAVVEIAEALDAGIAARDIGWIRGTVVKQLAEKEQDLLAELRADKDTLVLPSFEEISAASSKRTYAESFRIQSRNNDAINGKRLVEPYGTNLFVIQNPPMHPLTQLELDDVYELPYEYRSHPSYDRSGGVPGMEEVQFSLISNRGCFGDCSFCALTYHQGRSVQGRSKESIVKEAQSMIRRQGFKGYIHDVGGPTANFRGPACTKQLQHGVCKDKDCLFPNPCSQLIVDHSEYLSILRELRELPGVKKVFVRSGVRYDYAMSDPDDSFLTELCENHVSGTLKVAPEHSSDQVLRLMHKPGKKVFLEFTRRYEKINQKLGRKQYLIPYFISSHPGSTLKDAIELAVFLKETGFVPDQVQDFYPTPGTLSTCMYYTELDPFTGKPVYVPKSMEEKQMQRALMHFHKPENRDLVRKALIQAKREDLIPVLLGRSRG